MARPNRPTRRGYRYRSDEDEARARQRRQERTLRNRERMLREDRSKGIYRSEDEMWDAIDRARRNRGGTTGGLATGAAAKTALERMLSNTLSRGAASLVAPQTGLGVLDPSELAKSSELPDDEARVSGGKKARVGAPFMIDPLSSWDASPKAQPISMTVPSSSTPSSLRTKHGIDKAVIDTIMKEAVAGDLEDAKAIASVIANRAALTGRTWKEVVAAPGQFQAYTRKSFPPGVNQPKYRSLVEQAVEDVLTNGPTTEATYYATPSDVGALPKGTTDVMKTAGHVYRVDPANKPIKTSKGTIHLTKDRISAFKEKIADVANSIATAVGLDNQGQRGGPSRPKGRGLQDVADVTENPDAWSEVAGANIAGVDGRLVDISKNAAAQFAERHPGYSVQAFSGKKGRASGTPNHPGGRAIDRQITDPDGNVLPSSPARGPIGPAFGLYQELANIERQYQQSTYPDLDDDLAWGGYFQQGVAFDLMHIDLGGTRGAYGSFEEGLNATGKAAMARLGFDNVQNVGLRQQENTQLADTAPVPVGRPLENVASAEATLSPVASGAAAVPAVASGAQTVQPTSVSASNPVASLASLLSPVSTARAAEGPARETVQPSPATETVIGQEVTSPSSFPARPAPQIALNRAPGTLQPAESALAQIMGGTPVQPSTAPSVQPETPETITPLSLSQNIGPITPEALGAFPASVTQPRDPVEIVRALTPEVAPTVGPEDTITGTEPYETETVPDLPPAKVVKAPPKVATVPPAVVPPPQVVPAVPKAASVPIPQPRPQPALRPADIYGGKIGQAVDNSGDNIVSRDAYGRTAVTNKYGATTVTLPDGRQAASRQKGPFSGKSLSRGNLLDDLDISRNDIAGMLLGALAGGAVGGPAAAVGGAALGKRASGWLDGLFGFPDAPSKPSGYKGTNSSSDYMRGISPDVADAIDRGLAGLF